MMFGLVGSLDAGVHADVICPKCGEGVMGASVYCHAHAFARASSTATPICEPTEHLHRFCGGCGYYTTEPCADARGRS